ncbi:hypothetical protein [Spiroplasma turonicum]|uniref:Uncharacterized protein n=1 Tax=Spiroplasma turonicum TaxID=216946 RepID=A0A0K1P5V7_9MOLU|nr:hypothetical protein [Spiroplasma turonicum]AKU79698.1 hypothetical protein STURON_00452 [Spiroplasma turonicum]ALX70716.1 hypothetical protein STURO_v1c04500 [Spiroplasma turonicum]
MRIIPHELFIYTPDNSLTALRKEFGMYDYCLNINPKNKAMQPFLDLGRNYFNENLIKWIEEMEKRGHYVNSFHKVYFENITYTKTETDIFLLLECIIQWDLKQFSPYNINLTWYDLAIHILKKTNYKNLNINDYNNLSEFYKTNYMALDNKGKLKPKLLELIKVIDYFKHYLDSKY